jgi:hypothetical protein
VSTSEFPVTLLSFAFKTQKLPKPLVRRYIHHLLVKSIFDLLWGRRHGACLHSPPFPLLPRICCPPLAVFLVVFFFFFLVFICNKVKSMGFCFYAQHMRPLFPPPSLRTLSSITVHMLHTPLLSSLRFSPRVCMSFFSTLQ